MPSRLMTPSYNVLLSWWAVANATAYTLYRNGTLVYTGPALTFTDTVPAGPAATYKVTATVGGVEGAPGPETTITSTLNYSIPAVGP